MGNELYTVVGLVSTGDAQLDQMGAHLHIEDLQGLLVLPDAAHSITLISSDSDNLDSLVSSLKADLGDAVLVRTWKEVSPQIAEMFDFAPISWLEENGFLNQAIQWLHTEGVYEESIPPDIPTTKVSASFGIDLQ